MLIIGVRDIVRDYQYPSHMAREIIDAIRNTNKVTVRFLDPRDAGIYHTQRSGYFSDLSAVDDISQKVASPDPYGRCVEKMVQRDVHGVYVVTSWDRIVFERFPSEG